VNNKLQKLKEKDYDYKVSVCIITYNQAEYIERAIKGALRQKVDFPYEIIIGDDGSTDGTQEILLDYKEKYPDLIKLHLHEEHWEDGIPGRLNNITNINSAQGKYIAFCDGDDYWICENKLQKQADFMDANPEYSFCFTNVEYVWSHLEKKNRELKKLFYPLRKSRSMSKKEFTLRNFPVGASSTFYKASCIKNPPKWFWEIYSADIALQLIAVEQGKCYYFSKLMSIQYKNPGSVTQNFTKKREYEIQISNAEIFKSNLGKKNSYIWEVDSRKFFMKFLWEKDGGSSIKSLIYLVKAVYKDLNTIEFIYKGIISKIYRKFYVRD